MPISLRYVSFFIFGLLLTALVTHPTSAQVLDADFTALDGQANDRFGEYVAFSSDGQTAIVGSEAYDNSDFRSAYVFARQGDGSFAQQGELALPEDSLSSLALSSDGQVIVVGASHSDIGSNPDQGRVHVFVHQSNGSFVQQSSFTAPNGNAGDRFGRDVALSADGSHVLVGSSDVLVDSSDIAANVFVRQSNGTYVQRDEFAACDEFAGVLMTCPQETDPVRMLELCPNPTAQRHEKEKPHAAANR